MASPTICVIVLSFNSERTIEACLKSTAFADEVIVVDSGSTDKTIEIAKHCSATVYHQRWLGYAEQRNAAIQHATCDWILMLDSDEQLSDNAVLLKEYVQTTTVNGFSLPVQLKFKGKTYKYFHNKSNGFLRLFRKSSGTYNPNKQIHEDLNVKGNCSYKKDVIIYHDSFSNINDMIDKMNKYSSLNAEYSLKYRKRKQSTSLAVARFFASFIKHYIINKGIMDGSFGFVYSIHYALSSYFHTIKCTWTNVSHNTNIDALQKSDTS